MQVRSGLAGTLTEMRLICMREWLAWLGRVGGVAHGLSRPPERLAARVTAWVCSVDRSRFLARPDVADRCVPIGRLEAHARCSAAAVRLLGVLVHGAVDQLAAADGLRERDPDWGLRVR